MWVALIQLEAIQDSFIALKIMLWKKQQRKRFLAFSVVLLPHFYKTCLPQVCTEITPHQRLLFSLESLN